MNANDRRVDPLVQESLETYHAHPALSASGMKLLLRSPAHFRANALDDDDKETSAKLFGTLAHTAIIEPRRFLDHYVIKPDFDRRTKAGKEGHEAWLNGLPDDALVVSKDDADAIVGMIHSVQEHPTASELLKGGIPERSIYFEKNGCAVKTRPDYLNPTRRAVIDLKTTRDASYDAFQKQVASLKYHLQCAVQLDGVIQALEWREAIHVWIAVEKEAPYAVAVYVADETCVELGNRDYVKAVERFKHCTTTGTWPAYPTDPWNMAMPNWMIQRETM